MSDPNWEGFARDLLEEWPVRDVEASEFFETALRHGLIHEIPGGYDPEHHIDAEGICPEVGDPWYEYAFNVTADERRAALDAMLAKARDVRVKPLPWEEKGGLYCWPMNLHYYIEGQPGDYYAICMVGNDDVWQAENGATIEEMKAQCQAHFEAEILALIDQTAEGEA